MTYSTRASNSFQPMKTRSLICVSTANGRTMLAVEYTLSQAYVRSYLRAISKPIIDEWRDSKRFSLLLISHFRWRIFISVIGGGHSADKNRCSSLSSARTKKSHAPIPDGSSTATVRQRFVILGLICIDIRLSGQRTWLNKVSLLVWTLYSEDFSEYEWLVAFDRNNLTALPPSVPKILRFRG